MPWRIEEGLDAIRMMGDRLRKLVFGVLYNAKERALEKEHHQIGFVVILEDEHVIFRIKDNGQGIPEEEIENLFCIQTLTLPG